MPIRSICVYCGSRNGDDPRFAEVAKQVGTWIGTHGGQLVYGGGRNGLSKLTDGKLTITMTSPKELGGSGLFSPSLYTSVRF